MRRTFVFRGFATCGPLFFKMITWLGTPVLKKDRILDVFNGAEAVFLERSLHLLDDVLSDEEGMNLEENSSDPAREYIHLVLDQIDFRPFDVADQGCGFKTCIVEDLPQGRRRDADRLPTNVPPGRCRRQTSRGA